MKLLIDSFNQDGFDIPTDATIPESERNTRDSTALPGKLIPVDDGDANGNGVPDFADGFNTPESMSTAGGRFVPMTVELPSWLDHSTASFEISYNASDPHDMTRSLAQPFVYTPGPGQLRIWTKDASQSRNAASFRDGGDYVDPTPDGAAYTADDLQKLGFTDSNRSVTLWVEAVSPSQSLADQRIVFGVDPNGGTDFTRSDAIRLTAFDVKVTKVWSDQIPGASANFLPGGTGYQGPEYSGIFQGKPSNGFYPMPDYLLVGTRGTDDRLYMKANVSLAPDLPAVRNLVQFALYDPGYNAVLPQSGGPVDLGPASPTSAPFIPDTLTGSVASLNGYLLTDISLSLLSGALGGGATSSDIPTINVAWGLDENHDGILNTAEILQRVPYTIKPIGDAAYAEAMTKAAEGRLAYFARGYTNNFFYSFANNVGLHGAYNYPGGATLQAGEFKLDHNVGAIFNSSGTATIDKAVFVARAVSTLADPSGLVDDVAASGTLRSLIGDTVLKNAQAVRDWFGDPINSGQTAHTFTFSSADREVSFEYDANQDLFTAMGDVVTQGVNVSMTVSRTTDASTGAFVLAMSSASLSGLITDTYDFRADDFPAIVGAIMQAGYDGTADRTGGRVFKYELDLASTAPVAFPFSF